MTEPVIGRAVQAVEAPAALERKTIRGDTVVLRIPGSDDARSLHPLTHGSPAREAVWTYMGYGPWGDESAMADWISTAAASTDPLFYMVETGGSPVGMVSMLNVDLAMRRMELGHIWYVPEAQRIGVNTEVTHLLLAEAFNTYHCRRVEWKCDSLNAPSRHAAIRLGFNYEGTFRNHMIVKGHNRDTAWYAMTDEDWPSVNGVLAAWLAADDPKPSLTAMMQDGR